MEWLRAICSIVVATMRCWPWSRSIRYMRHHHHHHHQHHHHNKNWLTRVPPRRHLSKYSAGHRSISDILDLPPAVNGSEPFHIEATGHVRTVRNQKRMSFVELGDGSTTRSLQAILDPPQAEKYAYNVAEFRAIQPRKLMCELR